MTKGRLIQLKIPEASEIRLKIVVAIPTINESIKMAISLLIQCCCRSLSVRILSAAVS